MTLLETKLVDIPRPCYKVRIKFLPDMTWINFYTDSNVFDEYFDLKLPKDHEVYDLLAYCHRCEFCNYSLPSGKEVITDVFPGTRCILLESNSKKLTFLNGRRT